MGDLAFMDFMGGMALVSWHSQWSVAELLELGSLQEKNINKHDHEALSADTWNTTALLGHGHGMKARGATWTWLNMQNKNETLGATCIMEALCAGYQAMHLFRPAAVAMVAYRSPNPGVPAILVDIPQCCWNSWSISLDLLLTCWMCWDASWCIPISWRTARWTICSCFPAAFWVFWLWQLWPGHLPLWHGHWQLGPATECGSGKMSTNGNVGSFAYHQPQALEQLPVRLVPSVANMHSQKNASTTGIIRVWLQVPPWVELVVGHWSWRNPCWPLHA